jgi:hypothetical protein
LSSRKLSRRSEADEPKRTSQSARVDHPLRDLGRSRHPKYTPHDIFTWRTDFLNDARGQRTGFKTRYVECDLSYTHWIGDTIELRPELRYEHSFDTDAYDNPTAVAGGGKHSQLMLAADLILHF